MFQSKPVDSCCAIKERNVMPMEAVVNRLNAGIGNLENAIDQLRNTLFTDRLCPETEPPKPQAPTLRAELVEIAERIEVATKKVYVLKDCVHEELGDVKILD